jgi:hypothetical protein
VEIIKRTTHKTSEGVSVTVSVVKTNKPIRGAKHTSINDIRKMAKATSRQNRYNVVK